MRLRMILLLLICLSPALVAENSATEPAQQTFPLTCLPSRDYDLVLNVTAGPQTYAEVIFHFRRSSGNAAGLRPGECAWSDRRVADNEPAFVCARLPLYSGAKFTSEVAPTPAGLRYGLKFNNRETVFSRLLLDGFPPVTFPARQVDWPSAPGGRCLEMTEIP